jgi:hypothetical protein
MADTEANAIMKPDWQFLLHRVTFSIRLSQWMPENAAQLHGLQGSTLKCCHCQGVRTIDNIANGKAPT